MTIGTPCTLCGGVLPPHAFRVCDDCIDRYSQPKEDAQAEPKANGRVKAPPELEARIKLVREGTFFEASTMLKTDAEIMAGITEVLDATRHAGTPSDDPNIIRGLTVGKTLTQVIKDLDVRFLGNCLFCVRPCYSDGRSAEDHEESYRGIKHYLAHKDCATDHHQEGGTE